MSSDATPGATIVASIIGSDGMITITAAMPATMYMMIVNRVLSAFMVYPYGVMWVCFV